MNGNFTDMPLNTTDTQPELVLANSTGFGYGYFELDEISKDYLIKNLSGFTNPVNRCSMYITLWENMLNQNIAPNELLSSFINAIRTETEEQNISLVLNYISPLYWKFINIQRRELYSTDLENLLWQKVIDTKSAKLKYNYLKSYINISNTSKSIENLYKIWNKELAGFEYKTYQRMIIPNYHTKSL
ncbi:MAG: hypothetical protein MZW92_37415 [Comamonadaceae bacterium]|nr:hypothetical protein [Comamonadaceae bacterium]